MHARWLLAALAVTGAVGLAGCADRRDADAGPDEAFLRQAGQAHLAEILWGGIAAQRAQRPAVKEFAQRLVDEHRILYDRLEQVAQSKNLALPAAPPDEAERFADRLRDRPIAEFDREYLDRVVRAHEADLALYQAQMEQGRDPDIVAYAAKGVPALQEHLRIARDLAARTGAESARE